MGQSVGPMSWANEMDQSVLDRSVLNDGGQVGRSNRHKVVLGALEAVDAEPNLLRRKELIKTTRHTTQKIPREKGSDTPRKRENERFTALQKQSGKTKSCAAGYIQHAIKPRLRTFKCSCRGFHSLNISGGLDSVGDSLTTRVLG